MPENWKKARMVVALVGDEGWGLTLGKGFNYYRNEIIELLVVVFEPMRLKVRMTHKVYHGDCEPLTVSVADFELHGPFLIEWLPE